MGYTVRPDFYTIECGNPKVLPYLVEGDEGYEFSSRSVPDDFFKVCSQYSTRYTAEDVKIGSSSIWHTCYVFSEKDKLFAFSAQEACPVWLTNYIIENYTDEEPLLILWYS